MKPQGNGRVVLALFFCSGATALVYEVIWSKFLSLMFGSTVYAQTVVLAVFMGGLALGNRIFGRRADRMQQPVRVYGLLEVAIGIYAFAFPALDRIADFAFVRLGTGIADRTVALLALKGGMSVALLLGPTVLMGGTLPLLASWLQKSCGDARRRSARFYSVNSLGAVAGAGAAGFFLMPSLGLEAALQLTAFLNVVIGGIAFLLGRDDSAPSTAAKSSAPAAEEQPPRAGSWAVGIVAVTGAVSMGLEVLASRSLALIFGSSLQAFAIVLMAFILGIGLGSAWIASPRWRLVATERLIVLLLTGAAAWVTLLVFNIEKWVDVYRLARTGIPRSFAGYLYNQFFTAGLALVVIGIPAAWIGAVLPLLIRTRSRNESLLGSEVGRLLTWNTVGAVAGTLLTGFVLMPRFGLRNAFGALAIALALVALVVARLQRWNRGTFAAAAVTILAALLPFVGGEGWRHVMSSGIFRSHETQFDPNAMAQRKQHIKLLFYEDGPDATVSVEESDGVLSPAQRALRINGKVDATSGMDLSTQLLCAHLPLLAKPDARNVFVLGLGSGVTAGALLVHPIEQVDLAENCVPVVRSAKYFENWNRRVVNHPRARLWHEDARTVLKLRPQIYDVIINEPSNPWTVGVGSVFSREYYELAASRLKPGGICVQWFHVYEMQDSIVELVLRTFGSVFPHTEIWDAAAGDILILGSMQPWNSSPETFGRAFTMKGVKSDLAGIGIHSPEQLLARQLASQRTAFAIAGEGPIESDLFPLLEHVAPVAFFIGGRAKTLSLYDERTRQLQLSPTFKQAALRNLSSNDARSVFSTFESVNDELMCCILDLPAGAKIPCVFKPRDAQTTNPPSALDQAVASLNAGDTAKAERLVALALERNSGDGQARYVDRIIEREKQSRSGAVAPLAPAVNRRE
jgi:predicted membrane-bound spermidine synthase